MIDYKERITELCDFLSSEYGVRDPEAVEILLACQIESSSVRYPWIAIETDYYSLDTRPAWFNLSILPTPLPKLRIVRPRKTNKEIEELFEGGVPRIFVEPNYQMMPRQRYNDVMVPYLMQHVLRLRTPYPKRPYQNATARAKLTADVRDVLDNRWRQTECKLAKPPGGLLYWIEVLQRLSPYLRDWDTLVGNLTSLASRRAYLFDRAVNESDWAAVVRVMSNSIPVWVGRMIEELKKGRRWTTLRAIYPQRLVHHEVRRLKDHGVVHPWKDKWLLNNNDGLDQDILSLIHGEVVL